MAGTTWAYKGEVDPVSAAHVWRVLALIVGSSAVAVAVGFALPHDRPARWSAVLIGLGLVAVLLVVLGVLGRRFLRRGADTTPPPQAAFAIALGFLVALVPITIGLSGAYGIYRNVLFAPVLAVSTFGSRRMILLFAVPTIAAVAFASVAQGIPLEALPALLLTYGLTWGAVMAIVHMNHRDTVTDLDHQKAVAELSSIVATAATLDHGMEAMAPIVGALLDADAVEVRRVGPDTSDDGDLVASWSAGVRSRSAGPTADALRTALRQAGVVVGEHHILLAVPSDHATTGIVAIATRRPARFLARMTMLQRAEEARSALATLIRRMELLDRLEARSMTDSLTNLANRRALFDRLMRELAACRRDGRSLTVAMLDVDHFKAFNDSFGHLAGDDVLADLARLLRTRLRTTDLAARFGGEEFCLVLPRTSAAEAVAIVRDLHEGCRLLETARPITFSGGIAEWSPDDGVDTLLGRADRALYEAKANGRGRSVVAGPTWTGSSSDRVRVTPVDEIHLDS